MSLLLEWSLPRVAWPKKNLEARKANDYASAFFSHQVGANEHRRCVWCLLFFLRVDSRGLCFFCEFLYHLYPLAIFALELFEFCDLGLVVALGCLKERQHWPFLGSVPISWQCPSCPCPAPRFAVCRKLCSAQLSICTHTSKTFRKTTQNHQHISSSNRAKPYCALSLKAS